MRRRVSLIFYTDGRPGWAGPTPDLQLRDVQGPVVGMLGLHAAVDVAERALAQGGYLKEAGTFKVTVEYELTGESFCRSGRDYVALPGVLVTRT